MQKHGGRNSATTPDC